MGEYLLFGLIGQFNWFGLVYISLIGSLVSIVVVVRSHMSGGLAGWAAAIFTVSVYFAPGMVWIA